ncbi:hypothetical protein BJY59DRAFT_443324 [Rhodotorula toruloides]
MVWQTASRVRFPSAILLFSPAVLRCTLVEILLGVSRRQSAALFEMVGADLYLLPFPSAPWPRQALASACYWPEFPRAVIYTLPATPCSRLPSSFTSLFLLLAPRIPCCAAICLPDRGITGGIHKGPFSAACFHIPLGQLGLALREEPHPPSPPRPGQP